MLILNLTRGKSGIRVPLSLPATPEDINTAYGKLDELIDGDAPTKIAYTVSEVSFLDQYLRDKHTEIFAGLNELARKMDGMNEQELRTLDGALNAESINSVSDILRVADSLKNYIFVHGVTTEKELGAFLVDSGYQSVNPAGFNTFGTQYERVLPASSVANLFPFNYSGKTDPNGFYIGKDRYGSSIIVDLDRRAEDKTNASILILGNSGQGKSYLLKLLLVNCLEAGKTVICLDPEHELVELCQNLGGCFVDLMSGRYTSSETSAAARTAAERQICTRCCEPRKNILPAKRQLRRKAVTSPVSSWHPLKGTL